MKCVKMLLGLLYTLIGVASIAGGLLNSNLDHSLMICGESSHLQYYTDFHVAALQFRKLYHDELLGNDLPVNNSDPKQDYALASLADLRVGGYAFHEHPQFSLLYGKYTPQLLQQFAHLERKLQCTGFCMNDNADHSVRSRMGLKPDATPTSADRIAMLTQWRKDGFYVVLGTANTQFALKDSSDSTEIHQTNAFIKHIFGSNNLDEVYLVNDTSDDCADKVREVAGYLVYYLNYSMIGLGVFFLFSGISCFCYMYRKRKDDSS